MDYSKGEPNHFCVFSKKYQAFRSFNCIFSGYMLTQWRHSEGSNDQTPFQVSAEREQRCCWWSASATSCLSMFKISLKRLTVDRYWQAGHDGTDSWPFWYMDQCAYNKNLITWYTRISYKNRMYIYCNHNIIYRKNMPYFSIMRQSNIAMEVTQFIDDVPFSMHISFISPCLIRRRFPCTCALHDVVPGECGPRSLANGTHLWSAIRPATWLKIWGFLTVDFVFNGHL